MSSSQRLFDAGRGAGDLLNHDSFLDRARLERERDNDAGARRALGAYLVARLIDRLLEIDGSDAAAEGFAWQLEGCRRYVLDLEAAPEVSHLRGIIEAVTAEPVHRASMVRVSLSAYTHFLEHEGRWADALDMLSLGSRLLGEPVPPRELAAVALLAGGLNRLLARWEVATAAYRAAEEAAGLAGDVHSAFRARLGVCKVMRGQGNYPSSRQAIEAIIDESTDPSLADIQGMAYADLGAVLSRQGHKIDALRALYESFSRTHDPIQRMAVLGDLGIALAELGSRDAARCALEMVVESDTRFQLRMNARVELMDLESAAGNRLAFERHRTEARRSAAQMPPSMAVDFRYKAGVGLARFGQIDRAHELWREALTLAETYQLNDWYFKVDRTLRDSTPPASPKATFETEDELRSFGAVEAEIHDGLREARELTYA